MRTSDNAKLKLKLVAVGLRIVRVALLKKNTPYGKVNSPPDKISATMPNSKDALACFLSIARAIAGTTDYELVLENFANELRVLIPHDHLDIVLLHPSGMQVCYETRMHTTWSLEKNRKVSTEKSPIRAVLRGEVSKILTDDAWVDPMFSFEGADNQPLYDADLHSRIVVPLCVQGEIMGSLAISSHKIGFYSEEMVVIAHGAADLIAAYLFALECGIQARDAAVAETEARGREKALRIGAQLLTEGMEQERQRLGMDLHDQTLADLARIKRRVSRLNDKDININKEFSALDTALDDCLCDFRGIIEDLKPGVLQMFGFAEAVDAHLHRCLIHIKRDISIDVDDKTDGEIDKLTNTRLVSVFRIVQEAINNSLKHGNSTKILVEILKDNEKLIVRVDDNGSGLKQNDFQSKGGLTNIQTRAELISAKVSFDQIPQLGGTRVEVIIDNKKGV